MLCFLYYMQLGGVISVQYIARMSLIWLLRILLVLGMIFSISPPLSGVPAEQESTTSDNERYERKFIPPVRTASQMTPQLGAVKITEQWEPKSIALAAIIPVPALLFRPVIYKFLLRLRLYLLKFTSHFLIALRHNKFTSALYECQLQRI